MTEKKRFQASPIRGELAQNSSLIQAPFFQGPANPKSKIQNPKSSDQSLHDAPDFGYKEKKKIFLGIL
jgi:hypothetical protein